MEEINEQRGIHMMVTRAAVQKKDLDNLLGNGNDNFSASRR